MMTATKRLIRTVGCLLALATLGCESRRADSEDAAIAPGSVTVYPIVLAGHPSREVTRFVAVLIERGGLDAGKIEVGSEAFASDSPFDQQSRGFGAFAAKQSIRTDYALYCEYLGSTRGVDEVRSVLVDAGGRVVWSDRQRPGDREFDRIKPHDPETCTKLLMKRLRRPLGLADPFRRDAPKGTLAERFQREDGIPGKRERAAMAKRLAKLRDAAQNATVVVYPVRIDGEFSRKGAETLAGLLNKDKLLSARVAVTELRFGFTRSMNQQKVLWSAARSIQELVKKHSDADYVLLAHYIMNPRTGKAFAVHLFLLDPKAEFVIVDFQNENHSDFKRIKPGSPEECSKLALARLEGYLE